MHSRLTFQNRNKVGKGVAVTNPESAEIIGFVKAWNHQIGKIRGLVFMEQMLQL